jgi:inosine/xanthosine triphosphatase
MEKIIIAVGSKRGPKLNAVSAALAAVSSVLSPAASFEVLGVEVESGVSHTPSSRDELMRGSRQRAEALVQKAKASGASWNYFVGLEGGLEVVREGGSPEELLRHSALEENVHRRVFLESWAYVTDGAKGHFGRSGGIELPEALAHEVLESGVELSVAIDKFAGGVGIRDAQGAWGVLSGNCISREEAFRVAVIAAFAPFYNAKMYRGTAVGASGSVR